MCVRICMYVCLYIYHNIYYYSQSRHATNAMFAVISHSMLYNCKNIYTHAHTRTQPHTYTDIQLFACKLK